MSFGTFILGGEGNSGNSEFLKRGKSQWQDGPAIPSPGLACGCAVEVDDFQFAVIGGHPDGHSEAVANVRMYDMTSGTWTEWAPLNTPASYVACVTYGSTIVVGGGYRYNPTGKPLKMINMIKSFSAGDLAETTIINTNTGSNTVVAPLNTLRHGAYMTNLHNLVVAFGGWNTETSAPLTDLEIWNPNDNTWNNGPGQVFQTGRLKFGMITLSFPPGTCELETSYQEFSLNTRNTLYYG